MAECSGSGCDPRGSVREIVVDPGGRGSAMARLTPIAAPPAVAPAPKRAAAPMALVAPQCSRATVPHRPTWPDCVRRVGPVDRLHPEVIESVRLGLAAEGAARRLLWLPQGNQTMRRASRRGLRTWARSAGSFTNEGAGLS